MMIGNTTVHFRKPRLTVRHHKDLIRLNGHKIYPYYTHGGSRMWPTYGVCLICGQSWLGGADIQFGAIKCGDD